MSDEAARLRRLRDRLIEGVARLDGAHLNGHPVERLPGNVNVSFERADSESILLALDLRGVAASSGSACTSGSLEPSHVLSAIGLGPEVAAGTVRLTLGRWNGDAAIDDLRAVLPDVLGNLRAATAGRPPPRAADRAARRAARGHR